MASTTPDRVPEGWDAAASWYERVIAPNTALYCEDALRIAAVRPGERLLDVAAGTGALTLLAAKRGANVLATDFSPVMVERLRARVAREGLAGVEARVMDGQRLELPDGSFDVAASVFGLIFFPDRAKGLAEMRRVLRPGGRAVLVTWSVPPRVRVVSVVGDAVRAALPDLPPPPEPPAIFSMSDPKRIEQEMAAAGLRDVRVATVTHTWSLPTPESVWTDLAPSSPVFAALLERLGPEDRERVHQRLVQGVRAESGDGPVLLPSEAHVAVGVR